MHSPLHRLVVEKFYGVTRTNKASRRAITNVLHTLDGEKKWGLNIGSANTAIGYVDNDLLRLGTWVIKIHELYQFFSSN